MVVDLAYLQLAVFDIISRAYMPVHCTEHHDWGGWRRQRPSRQIFPWPSRCGGEEIRLIVRDKELFVNREQVRASFCKTGEVWFVCVRSRSDGYWWKMAGTTSSPTQDLFDSQDFENAGIGHDNITSFKLILQMLGVMLHLRRGNY